MKEYECIICGEKFEKYHQLKYHRKKKESCRLALKELKERERFLKEEKYANFKYVCKYCEKRFEYEEEVVKHKGNCFSYRKFANELLSKEYLTEMLIERGLTVYHFYTEILNKEIGMDLIRQKCKNYDIHIRNSQEASSLDSVKEKRENTVKEKYGAHNVLCKNTESFQKRQETIKEKYGVDNVFQLESVKNKSKQTNIEKYGVDHYVKTEEYNKHRNNGRRSKLQKQVESILKDNNIEYDYEVTCMFESFNEFFGRLYSPVVDILVKHKKTVIEVNGDMWHANPEIYKPNDEIRVWGGLKTAKEIWEKDKHRLLQIKNKGYNVIVIWERDIKENFDKVRKTICDSLK